MEKFFIVINNDLIELVKEYENMRKKIDNAFMELREAYGIDSCEYYATTDLLRIVPTEKDKIKFNNQLKVDGESFKKNSSMNKIWLKFCKERNLKTIHKPIYELAYLINPNIYHFKSRLFSLGEEVCGSFHSDICFNLPQEHFIELKASEFYKKVEDYEEIIKNN